MHLFPIFKKQPFAILDFKIFAIFVKNSKYCLFLVDLQNLVKIGRSATKLLRFFNFQNGGRPPSWIWYDVIMDHLRLVFNGLNILLKLHFDRIYTLQHIAFFYIRPVWLEIAYSRPFLGIFGDITQNEFRYC